MDLDTLDDDNEVLRKFRPTHVTSKAPYGLHLQPIAEAPKLVQETPVFPANAGGAVNRNEYGQAPAIPRKLPGGAKGKLIVKDQLRRGAKNPMTKITTNIQHTASPIPRNKLSMIDQSPIEPSRGDSNETGPRQRKPNLISGYQSIDSFVPIDVGIGLGKPINRQSKISPNQYGNKVPKKQSQKMSYDEAGALASRVSAPHLGLGQSHD